MDEKLHQSWLYIPNSVGLSWLEVGYIKHCLKWGGLGEEQEQEQEQQQEKKHDFMAHLASWSELSRVSATKSN